MGAHGPADAGAQGLQALANELSCACHRLRDSLAVVQEAGLEGLDGHWRRHVAEARALRARISTVAAELTRRHGRHTPVAEPLRRRLDEAAAVLKRAEDAYAQIARTVSDSLSETRQRLTDVRRGGKALRGYARGVTKSSRSARTARRTSPPSAGRRLPFA